VKFLIDQQLPANLAVWFDRNGHPAVHVRDLGMREASDQLIWLYAAEHDAIIVTKDEDFAIMRARADEGPQVVWLRIGNATNRALHAHLDEVWPNVLRWLEAGEPIVEA
jgi:predicted nuclease of predicted toxin-antitoxin system